MSQRAIDTRPKVTIRYYSDVRTKALKLKVAHASSLALRV